MRGGGSREKSISDRCQDELTLGLGHVLSGRGGGGGAGPARETPARRNLDSVQSVNRVPVKRGSRG